MTLANKSVILGNFYCQQRLTASAANADSAKAEALNCRLSDKHHFSVFGQRP